MSDTKEKPGIDERYSNATHATSLVVSEIRTGAADMLIAAGWSRSRLGASLLRLVSEWDGAEKPRPVPPQGIERLSETLAKESGQWHGEVSEKFRREARSEAARWLLHEQKIMMGKLKTLPEVRRALLFWLNENGIPEPDKTASETLSWWLDATCRHCHGRRWEEIKDTGRLGNVACPACRGSGERQRPGGLQTNLVLVFLDDCVNRARASMKTKLRRFAPSKETS
jgi:hypothetical protein